jgi:23S rRNA pseudouridine2605 synthase
MALERLHKVMAAAGAGSRRECEAFIEEGRVTVDGVAVRELGTKVDPENAVIRFDGGVLKINRPVYYMVNKPRGVISTCRDEMGRPGVLDLIPGTPKRIYPVGRLDAESTGLVLLTNDGELAQKLTHPSFEVIKTYDVRVKGDVRGESLDEMKKGIWLSDGRARIEGAEIKRRGKRATDLVITLHEGKNREIRRVMARVGHPVLLLRRTSIGTLHLGDLKEGRHRKLTADEVAMLKTLAAKAGRKRAAQRRTGLKRKPSGPMQGSRRS